jgi:hypothetical protein
VSEYNANNLAQKRRKREANPSKRKIAAHFDPMNNAKINCDHCQNDRVWGGRLLDYQDGDKGRQFYCSKCNRLFSWRYVYPNGKKPPKRQRSKENKALFFSRTTTAPSINPLLQQTKKPRTPVANYRNPIQASVEVIKLLQQDEATAEQIAKKLKESPRYIGAILQELINEEEAVISYDPITKKYKYLVDGLS